ncbi:ABC transporter ATP-binding protein [Actinoplanes sp. NPDC024001]|uniref:ABC transporter ATP-binding protein n=1 Tax=Actinoplanes sp. NPDC024001 TaxID=3154598 RepID=UPI0033F23597
MTLPLLAVAAAVAAVAQLALPLAIGRAVDAVVAGGAAGPRLTWVFALVAVLMVADPMRDLLAGLAPAGRTGQLRRRLVRHTLVLGARRPDPAGDVVSRVLTGAAEAGQGGVAVVLAVVSVVPVAGAVAALAYLDPWLIAGYLAGVVAIAALLRRHVRDTSDTVVRYQRAQAEIAARLAGALAGRRTIAAAATVRAEVARCLRPLPELSAAGHGMWRVLARSAGQSALVGPLLQVSVVAVAGWLLARGRLTPGELLAAVQYGALGAGIGGLVAGFTRVARARAGARRVAEVLDRPVPRHGRRDLPPGPGVLVFRDVTVRGDGAPIIDRVSVTLPGGRPVAVVGRSGSGKSTFAGLAARLTDPDRGQVRLDGVPLPELAADVLRREVGVAFERPVLVGATVADAVALAHDRPEDATVADTVALAHDRPEDATVADTVALAHDRPEDATVADAVALAHDRPGDATVAGVLEAACASGFVSRLPQGAATALAEAPFSGGETQRLGLARAWHARRLLVLDDATSSLDTATEAEILRLLTGDVRRTHLIVAHRAGTAAQCATVVWLDRGRVRAVAPHRDLWADPAYRAVFGAVT